MILWTLKFVLNVVVKKLVSDWIGLALFGKKLKTLKERSGIIGSLDFLDFHECLDKDSAKVVKSLHFNKMFLFMNYEFLFAVHSWWYEDNSHPENSHPNNSHPDNSHLENCHQDNSHLR